MRLSRTKPVSQARHRRTCGVCADAQRLEIEAEFVTAHTAGHDVARLQSGDLSIYSALAEQLRRLDRHGIPYTLTPGVPAFAAAAAALQCELTVPEIAQSVVLTRVGGRASRMPEKEQLATFAASGATLVLRLL